MSSTPPTSEALRAQGNDLYKSDKIDQAIPLYLQAAELAPQDAAPLLNLSAAYYETGDYVSCLRASDQALDLLVDQAKRQKILLRKAKAHAFLQDFDHAASLLDEIEPSDEKVELERAVVDASQSRRAEQNAKAIHNRIIVDLPRCKQQIRNIPEYFVTGHDDPESLYSSSLVDDKEEKISLFFAGVGDARNLHRTFLDLALVLKKSDGRKCFHITINDHKPAVIARDILVILLLAELAKGKDKLEQWETFMWPALYYVYLGCIMPADIHALVQVRIGWIIEILEDNAEASPIWLDVPKTFRPALIRIYKQWQHAAGAEYGTSRIRKEVIRARNQTQASRLAFAAKLRMQYGPGRGESSRFDGPAGCEKEYAFYMKTGILTMDWLGHEQIYEAEVHQAFLKFNPKKPDRLDTSFLKTVDENWKTNPTFIDLDWQHNREDSHLDVSSIAQDPFEFAEQLSNIGMVVERAGLLSMCSYWFSAVADGFRAIRLHLKIEVCVGDVTSVFEQIRYGTTGHRTPADPLGTLEHNIDDSDEDSESEWEDEESDEGTEPSQKKTELSQKETEPSEMETERSQKDTGPSPKETEMSEKETEPSEKETEPSEKETEPPQKETEPSQKELDRMAQPAALQEYPKRYHRIHLSNIPDYIGGSLSTFLYSVPLIQPGKSSYVTANCLLNPHCFDTHDHYNNEYIALSNPKQLERLFHVRMKPFDEPDQPLIMTEYAIWNHVSVSARFSDLMPRATLQTWLYRLFLKIVLPIEREPRGDNRMFSSLNLTMLLRLCGHLHNVGHPAHWLNTVLDAIFSGSITTKARPPRSNPLTLADAKSNNISLQQSTAPFVAELTTLASLWQFALPFGLVSQHIPPIQRVHKYRFYFPEFSDYVAEPPVFALVLFDYTLMPDWGTRGGLRQILLSDEDKSSSKKARVAREKGIHVITTWKWNRDRGSATFWLRSDLFDSLAKLDEWGISIWRTDVWGLHDGPYSLAEVRDLGQYIK